MHSISCTKQHKEIGAMVGSLSKPLIWWAMNILKGVFQHLYTPYGVLWYSGVYWLWMAVAIVHVQELPYQLTYTWPRLHLITNTHTHTHILHAHYTHTTHTHTHTHYTHTTHTLHTHTHTHTHTGTSFARGDNVPTVQQQEESCLHPYSSIIHLRHILRQPLQQAVG